jgi:tetratricopeptide (TPR) repeat protein
LAYHTIREVVQEKPTDDEACLFEGVALDLLERHDEASSRFAYLAENAEDETLRIKAKYNEAVSLFRKYRPEDLEIAITKLDEIVGKSPDLEALIGDPIKALAFAAKANAIAHRFIFWRKTLENKTQEEQRATIEGWTTEVDDILDQLRELPGIVKSREKVAEWDALLLRQLQWAIDNAKGNSRLNLAMRVYSDLNLPGDAAAKRSESLKAALDAFRRCEVLLPAGVETLTNIATTLLLLDKREESRRYAQRAIELNKNYEYAYYRLTQSWIDDNRADEAVKVLNNFPRAPQIPGFKELFNRYYVQPKSA